MKILPYYLIDLIASERSYRFGLFVGDQQDSQFSPLEIPVVALQHTQGRQSREARDRTVRSRAGSYF